MRKHLRFICESVIKGGSLSSSERLFFFFFWQKIDFLIYQVYILISTDDHKKGTRSENLFWQHPAFKHYSTSQITAVNVCLHLDSLLYCTAGTMSNQNIQVMNVSSPLCTLNLSPFSLGVLSSGPVWSWLSHFPASDIKLSLTLQMVRFNTASIFFFFFLHYFEVLISAGRSMWCFVWLLVSSIATEGVKQVEFISLCCYIILKEGGI